ncbi:MAG: hypothetical protein AB8B95_07990 [Pseudohongiellaceae bacterium]
MLKALRKRFDTLLASLTPSPLAWRGAGDGVLSVGLIVIGLFFYFTNISHFSFQKLPAFFAWIGFPALLGLLGLLTAATVMDFPRRYRLCLALVAPLLCLAVFPGPDNTGYIAGAALLFAFSLIGGGSGVLISAGFDLAKHRLAGASIGVGVGILCLGIFLVFSAKEVANPALAGFVLEDKTLDLANPGLPGNFEVGYLTYGSGKDIRRKEFSENADLIARTVDGSKLIDNWEGLTGQLRTSYWGFDVTELPLQGRVWYPQGTGPFPLVLVVHGNHSMEDYSDPGYDYLGELLASRGIILASVDENFINSSFSSYINFFADRPGLKEENDARGWLLLEHLSQFRDWNNEAGNFFSNKIDMDKLALIGHSRGGEAVGIAAAFNPLSRYPDDASLKFDFNFNLKGVIAIAPVYGQYEPRERPTPVVDVNYLTVHGNMDGDVQSFEGLGQYSRVSFSGDEYRFKSSLYIVGANHGQFNTTWENMDTSPFRGWSLDTSRLMPREAQRDVARVYFSGFLETVFSDSGDYLAMFKDSRFASRWLPNTFYINQFSDSAENIIVDFENDIDVTTLDGGGNVVGQNLSRWYEVANELKFDELDTHSAVFAWDNEVHAEPAKIDFSLAYPASGELLVASLSSAGIPTKPKGWRSDTVEGNDSSQLDSLAPERDLQDWTIVLEDREGNQASSLLSRDSKLYPLIKGIPYRAKFLNSTTPEEILFRRFELPIADFAAVTGSFDATSIAKISFVFDQTDRGSIMLDSIAIQ